MVKANQAKGEKCSYVFDGYCHKSAKEFMEFVTPVFGSPAYWLPVTCDTAAACERWKKANEADEVGEEAMEEINGGEAAFTADCETINKELEGLSCKVHATLSNGNSSATTTAALKALT